MRVALVTNLFPPIQTGSALWTADLARELAMAGDDVVVITGAAPGAADGEAQETAGYVTYRLPIVAKLPAVSLFLNSSKFVLLNSAANRTRALEVLRHHGTELIHQCGQLLDTVMLSTVVAKGLGVPAVCSIHSKVYHPASPIYNMLLQAADRGVLARRIMPQYAGCIALDDVLEQYAAEVYRPHRLMQLPVCVDARLLRQPRVLPVDKGDAIDVISVGHVTAMRDRGDLLRAVARLRGDGFNIRLTVVGDEMTDAPRRVARELGLANDVVFKGEVHNQELLALLRAADIEAHWLTIPGIGTAALEAMALGLPVVTHAYEGIYRNVPLRDRENVVFIDPSKPETIYAGLRFLCDDADRRRQLGCRGRNLVERYLTWTSALPQLRSFYHEITA